MVNCSVNVSVIEIALVSRLRHYADLDAYDCGASCLVRLLSLFSTLTAKRAGPHTFVLQCVGVSTVPTRVYSLIHQRGCRCPVVVCKTRNVEWNGLVELRKPLCLLSTSLS